ncbi:MAG: DUF2867 domain-containing protein [Burkholderiaceae bacterium]
MKTARAVDFPAGTSLAGCFGSTHLTDAFSISLPAGVDTDPERLARFLLAQQPGWMKALLALRDALVAPLGLKTTQSLQLHDDSEPFERISFFRVYQIKPAEIILGEDDTHLDFRLSVHVQPEQVVLATVVHCHNRLGRAYLKLILPFHRMVAKAVLQRAAATGWPARAAG